MTKPEKLDVVIGDLIYAEDQNCWGNHSKYIHFGKVMKITKTGRIAVDILKNVIVSTTRNPTNSIDDYDNVVIPGSNITCHITLNSDGTVRGKNFSDNYITFVKYSPELILKELFDMGGQ